MTSFLITCTNATCVVPEAHRELFRGYEDLITSEKGWEPGALNLAQGLAMKFSTPLIHGEVTKLLIDLDQDGEARWSEISEKLPETTRDKLVTRLEEKFRHAIEIRLTEDFKRHNLVIHFLIHTAPLADGKILFEYTGASLAADIALSAAKLLPQGEVDSSAIPMKNMSPFVHWLTDTFASDNYGVIRVTVSHSFFLRSIPMRWETIKKSLIQALTNATK